MIGIYVFSATGNTYRCAEYMKKKWEEKGANVSLTRIESGKERVESLPETLVIAYPVHGFNTPYNVMNFVKGLPRVNGCAADPQRKIKVYFLKSSGEPLHWNDNSSRAPSRVLKRKGYEISGEFHYIMPYDLIFRHTDEMAAKMWEAAKTRMDSDHKLVLDGETRPIKAGAKARFMCGVCKIQRFGMKWNGRFYKINREKCVRCMKCVKACPVGNISFKGGKFTFGGKCVGCMRCAFLCPSDAFKIGFMDKWRVNGAYDFSADPKKAEICDFCREAYERYFAETDEKYGKRVKIRKEVVAALIERGDRFMICRRPEGKARAGLWEFVGGKAEDGESREDALIRECEEEIGVKIKVGDVFAETTHDYADISVHLTIFRAEIESGEPRPMEKNAIAWITPAEIPNYAFCAADIPIMREIEKEGTKKAFRAKLSRG